MGLKAQKFQDFSLRLGKSPLSWLNFLRVYLVAIIKLFRAISCSVYTVLNKLVNIFKRICLCCVYECVHAAENL